MRLLAAALLLLSAAVAARVPTVRVNDAAIVADGFPAQLSEFRFFVGNGKSAQDSDTLSTKPVRPELVEGSSFSSCRSAQPHKEGQWLALRALFESDKLSMDGVGGGMGESLQAPLVPAPGVTPYAVTTPLWSDGAEKLRFAYVPPGLKAKAQGEGLLDFPVGSALIKTFKMGGKLIETRVLLHRAEGWVGLPYKWNAEQTEARLVLGGAREELTTPAGQTISYAIPNKNQCKECHALNGTLVPIGPKARNLSAAWLAGFRKAGHLDKVPKVARRVPEWSQRAKVPVAAAARGWLDANCAHCHNPAGLASNSGLYLGWDESDPARLGVMKRPVAAGRGSGNLEFGIVPGNPGASILVYRLESLEGGIAMPELGRSSRDVEGEAAVRAWISEMKR